MNIAVPEVDYVDLSAPDIVRVDRLLPGPIERVWEYLTDPQLRGTWFCAGEFEPRVGGKVEMIFRNGTLTQDDDAPSPELAHLNEEKRMQGVVTDYDPPRLLAYDWGVGEAGSHVRFELAKEGAQVRLRVVHSRMVTRNGRLQVSAGWHTHLDLLRDRLLARTPEGFWRKFQQLEQEYDARLPR